MLSLFSDLFWLGRSVEELSLTGGEADVSQSVVEVDCFTDSWCWCWCACEVWEVWVLCFCFVAVGTSGLGSEEL